MAKQHADGSLDGSRRQAGSPEPLQQSESDDQRQMASNEPMITTG